MGFEICGILVLWEKGGEEGRNRERKVGQEPWSIKQCAYHGWGTHVSKECYASKKAKEILENGKRNNDSNSPPVQVNTLKNEQLREELNEMKAQMALILEKMPNQQSNA